MKQQSLLGLSQEIENIHPQEDKYTKALSSIIYNNDERTPKTLC